MKVERKKEEDQWEKEREKKGIVRENTCMKTL
jgi:hypothetical protein